MALLKGNEVACSQCGDENILMITTATDVYCECANGHGWREPYAEDGGTVARPETPTRHLEDILSSKESTLYQTILDEIAKNIDFYLNAEPTQKYKKLAQACDAEQKMILTLFRKITLYHNAMKGG